MPAPLVTPLPNLRNQLGEGAIWHTRTGQLYWVDIAGHTVHSYEPATGRTRTALVGESVGTVVPTTRAEVLIARQRDFAFLDLDRGRLTPFPIEPLLPPDQRFNDGKCDADGRLWVGSMDCTVTPGDGRLWCLDPSLRAEPRRQNLTIPNGIAWSRDGLTLFHVDSVPRRLEAFDFNPVDGALSRPRTLREFSADDGYPDGMTLDADGHLWIALWNGWRVVRIDSATGATLAEIALPVQRPTACAFGGPALDTLYITSARHGLAFDELDRQPLAGALFATVPGVAGLPAHEFAG
jgi:sugar lactone lactonase YvrE